MPGKPIRNGYTLPARLRRTASPFTMTRLIGILGGTFDPVHFGHLRPGLDVFQDLGLDELRFIPLREPPHRDRPKASATERLQMVQLAITGQPGFLVDDRELHRTGHSYTLDTLLSLHQEKRTDDRLCLLMGADAFLGFPTWHQPTQILGLAHLIVMQRPHTRLVETPDLQPFMKHETRDLRQLKATPAGAVFLHPVTQLQISATTIRALITRGLSPRYLLPEPVLDFIKEHSLYG